MPILQYLEPLKLNYSAVMGSWLGEYSESTRERISGTFTNRPLYIVLPLENATLEKTLEETQEMVTSTSGLY